MNQNYMFTSESVTEGHPDKLCDQISDAIVDRFLQKDPFSRVVTECAVATAIVFIAARYESDAVVDLAQVARRVIRQVGYDQPDFNSRTCSVITSIKEQPTNGNRHLDECQLSDEDIDQIAARNQVTLFGFACNQTPALMPLPIWLAHQLARRLAVVRYEKRLPDLAPDGKIQVGVEYRDRTPHRIHSITLVSSHDPLLPSSDIDLKQIYEGLRESVIDVVFEAEPLRPDAQTRIVIDLGSSLAVGGPSIHAGLTGRKTAIDTYGEYARHSGAALSGKDPSRIDRIGAYAARYAAKNLVAAGLAEACEVQLSYSMGLAHPVSLQVETFGTGQRPDSHLAQQVQQIFDFRPAGIIRQFNLRFLPTLQDGFYQKLAAYGQVGRLDLGLLPWEATDRVAALQDGG